MNAEESELLRATEWNRAEQQKRALKAELLISRIQSALATGEEGEALLEVVKHAHEAEQELAVLEKYKVTPAMRTELAAHIATLTITSDNIGEVRRSLFMPFDCDWNGWVRELTADRENQ